MDYKFTNNVPNKDKIFDSISNELPDNFEDSVEEEVGSSYLYGESDEVEIEMTKDKEGHYLISTGLINKKESQEEDDEETDKVIIYPATQLYISGMTVVGLFILYRLMMRYK
jgi:hypothetical protein